MLRRYGIVSILIIVGSFQCASGACRQASQRVCQKVMQASKNVAKQAQVAKTKINQCCQTVKQQYQGSSYQQRWDCYKGPILGIAVASAASAGTIQGLLLAHNKYLQEELENTLDDENILSGMDYKRGKCYLDRIIKRIPRSAKYQFKVALEKEAELLKQGYICFYHAQNSVYSSMNDVLNTVFFKLAGQMKPNDFMFLQIRPEDLARRSVYARNKEHEKLMRGDSEYNPLPLAVNLLAFGNTGGDEGSSTLHYLIDNHSNRGFDIFKFMNALQAMGLSDASRNKIEPFVRRVEELNKSVFKTGRLLLIAIPTQKVDQYVFPACYKGTFLDEEKGVYAGSRTDMRKSMFKNGRCIHTMSGIIDAIVADPSYIPAFEGAIPIDTVGLLNPYSGIKIFAIDGLPTSYDLKQDLIQAEKQLVDVIMAEFDVNGKREIGQNITQNHMRMLPTIIENKPGWLDYMYGTVGW